MVERKMVESLMAGLSIARDVAMKFMERATTAQRWREHILCILSRLLGLLCCKKVKAMKCAGRGIIGSVGRNKGSRMEWNLLNIEAWLRVHPTAGIISIDSLLSEHMMRF
jgi:hypothetical protein